LEKDVEEGIHEENEKVVGGGARLFLFVQAELKGGFTDFARGSVARIDPRNHAFCVDKPGEARAMTGTNEFTGVFVFEADSARFHGLLFVVLLLVVLLLVVLLLVVCCLLFVVCGLLFPWVHRPLIPMRYQFFYPKV
jgi:hypothetical protein